MTNHCRTLLLNQAAFPDYAAFLAEEYTPPAYRPRALPAYLAAVRRVLFGSSPDRHMLNYRGRQLLTLVHATPLADHATADDPRLTYPTDASDDTLFPSAAFAPRVTPLGEAPAGAIVSGRSLPPDADGKVFKAYRVEVLSGSTGSVSSDQVPIQKPVFDPSAGEPVTLPGSGYALALPPSPPTGSVWLVETLNRPRWDPGSLLETVGSVGEPYLVALFGADDAEPYKTFRNAFASPDAGVPVRLAATVLAAARRTGELEG